MRARLTNKIIKKFNAFIGNDIENAYGDGQSISENEYHRLIAELQKVQKRRRSKVIPFCILILSLVYPVLIYYPTLAKYWLSGINISMFAAYFIVYFLLGLLVSLLFHVWLEGREASIQSKIFEYELNNAKEEAEEDIFKNSIKMSSKYLDQYYLQTKQQAQKGFFITVCVAIFGAGLIAVGIVLMFFGKVEPSYVTCASGVITEFIAAIFFYLYNRTVSSMSNYHNKLVLAQNISIALKVSDSLPEEDSAEAKKQIVTELLKDMNDHLIKDDPPTKFGK